MIVSNTECDVSAIVPIITDILTFTLRHIRVSFIRYL